MNRRAFAKTKMGQLPGDLPKQVKIEMLERSGTITYVRFGPCVQLIDPWAKKGFKRLLRSKERARLKESFQSRIKEEQ